ncbi:MAG: enoyl-CoA hydratase-related protein, partial [Acidimicrobiia bacterium]
MTSDPVLFSLDAGVALITLNRPDVRNAFNAEMGAMLSDAYARCDADDSVRAVVITGTPPA